MQEYKIFNYTTSIPKIGEYSFIVSKDVNNELLSEFFDELKEDYRTSTPDSLIDFDVYEIILNNMLNPLNFKIDSIVTKVLIDNALHNNYLYSDEPTFNSFTTEFLTEKLKICEINCNNKSFENYWKKIESYNSDDDKSVHEIIKLRTKYCEYFKKIYEFDSVSILVIDKYINDFHYFKGYDKFCFNSQEANYYNLLEIKRMESSLKTIQNFKSIFNLTKLGNDVIIKNLSLEFKKNRGVEKIEITQNILKVVITEIARKTEEVFENYNTLFNPNRYNYLKIRKSEKMNLEYDNIIKDLDNYELKIDQISSRLRKKIKNYKLGKFHNYDSNLAIGINNFFADKIFVTTNLDFLIIEILGLAGVICKTDTHKITYLPKKYSSPGDFASDRQNELDSLKKIWIHY